MHPGPDTSLDKGMHASPAGHAGGQVTPTSSGDGFGVVHATTNPNTTTHFITRSSIAPMRPAAVTGHPSASPVSCP